MRTTVLILKNSRRIISVFFLFSLVVFLDGCSYSFIINDTDQYIGNKIVYNKPMIYTANLGNDYGGPTHSSYKENRLLREFQESSINPHHVYKDSIPKISYIKSSMEFTVVGTYHIVHLGAKRLFNQGYQMYELKDEKGIISSVHIYDVQAYDKDKESKTSKPTCQFHRDIDEAVLDNMYETKQLRTVKINLWTYEKSAEELSKIKKKLLHKISYYNCTVIDTEDNTCGITLKGDVDTIAFLYTSKTGLGIYKIFIVN